VLQVELYFDEGVWLCGPRSLFRRVSEWRRIINGFKKSVYWY